MSGNDQRTEIITDRVQTVLVREHRRDPLKGLLMLDTIAVAVMAGTQAVFTHHQWIRTCDTVLVVAAVLEFARLLLTRGEDW